jgi:hypothetical protein
MRRTVPLKTEHLRVPGATIYASGQPWTRSFQPTAQTESDRRCRSSWFKTRIRGGPPPPPPGEPTPQMREGMARMKRNMDFWLGHSFSAVAAYEPDFDALKAGLTRIVPAVGDESRGEPAHEGGLGLGERLGTQAEFAAQLRKVLEG